MGWPRRPSPQPLWIDRAIELEGQGKREESLDAIFDGLDELLLNGKFEQCAAILSLLPVQRLSNAQLLTVLTASLPARNKLSTREALVDRVKALLKARGADVARLMVGLD
jgi:hypothetical protein